MDAQEIRTTFLDYFAARGHTVRPSDSLVPSSDPTLIFTSAGMVPFKALWTDAPLQFQRAASVQKCLRVGGKDSDLENVGRTLRHHSFFEMLGNFSFGDYFKQEAIEWAWKFSVEVMNLPKDRLWVSVFEDDDGALELWKKTAGIPEEKIVRLDKKDNFWGPAGLSGPCGPCSEIYFDRGEKFGCGNPECRPGCDCERYLEFWNLVFPQFYQDETGNRRPLERRGIDTGMGLERLALLVQGAESNYDTDLFLPILSALKEIVPAAPGPAGREAEHVIADHIRALTFALSENVLPANEGRGYVMRRLLRRAVRFGRKLSLEGPFLYKLVPAVVEVMKESYPELLESRDHVQRIIRAEEERFGDTLTLGLEKLAEIAGSLKKKGEKVIPGGEVFKLSDTYGFPPELTDEVAREEGLEIDWPAFKEALAEQKERGRAAWKGLAEEEVLPVYHEIGKKFPPVEFRGYDRLAVRGEIISLIRGGKETGRAGKGEEVEAVLDQTSFYAEAGGQVGDSGLIKTPSGTLEVAETARPLEGLIVHRGKVIEGEVAPGEAEALVDRERRRRIERHHTATHLLQQALREVVGDHIGQAGSFVAPDYFRFDFSHFEAVKPEDLSRVEARVNEMIREDWPVNVFHLSLATAKEQGALAFFGEKYGRQVRMIEVGGLSRELCGGTHVRRTGEIGIFLLLSESSVASGVRRIEAVCGDRAFEKTIHTREIVLEVCGSLKIAPEELPGRVEKLTERIKILENEIKNLKKKKAADNLGEIIEQAQTVAGVKLLAADLGETGMETLRSLADEVKGRLGSGIAVLAGKEGEKAFLVAAVTPDLVKTGRHAGNIVKEVAKLIGGSGGGRPDLAQAGGKSPEKIKEALEAVPGIVKKLGMGSSQ
ncbi:MAG: alanine--tRNA ligase [Candidatus Erginobacter occultus]|nr:alanine--tRNA ligase [Candidatus Erginobacter occultus]